jgi:hypothetical protein
MSNARLLLIKLSLIAIGTGALLVTLGAAHVPPFRSKAVWVAMGATGTKHTSSRIPAARQSPLERYGELPLIFEANEGQTDPQVDFLSRGSGFTLFLTAAGISLALPQQQDARRAYRTTSSSLSAQHFKIDVGKSTTVRMNLIGANAHPAKVGVDEQTTKVNYFLGNDSTKWRSRISTYAKVKYQDVYAGVDLIYYGNQHQLEYDFVVAPGIDPKAITLEFMGVEKLRVDGQGDVVLQTGVGPRLELHKPHVYQEAGGVRRKVSAGYVLDKDRVSFQLGAYDATRPLVIDPAFVYSTQLKGGDEDAGWAVAVDHAGNAYVTGDTNSIDFPLARPLQRASGGSTDVFVAKLSANGSRLIYSTYLGGSDADVGYGIAVDLAGNAYITGDTSSADFPLKKPLQSTLGGAPDVFVAKLSADGSKLIYSTYIGGSNGERGNGIAVDPAGDAYVTGYTHSANFPTSNPIQPAFAGGNADAFVLKLNPSGSALIYSTYLGGGNDRPDIGNAIAVDSSGNAYVTGLTNSRDFPTVKPLQSFVGPTDVFVSKLNPGGTALVYSTFLGGSADDEAMGIAVDASGSAYVTGETESPDFPTTPGAFSTSCVTVPTPGKIPKICSGGDVFISKLRPDGSALVYSTYLNGSGFEVGRTIAVDSAGDAYVAGITSSHDFPTLNPLRKGFGKAGWGALDAFVVKLNPTGSALIYSTYLGGSGDDAAYGIAVDAAGNAYVTGYTESPDFPTRHPLHVTRPRALRGVRHAFITKIAENAASSR